MNAMRVPPEFEWIRSVWPRFATDGSVDRAGDSDSLWPPSQRRRSPGVRRTRLQAVSTPRSTTQACAASLLQDARSSQPRRSKPSTEQDRHPLW